MAKYDFVIIGSGLGGLLCGYMLAKEGRSVCILEKNRQLGGNLQIFVRDKAIFDTGIHYIGGLDKGQNLYQYFKYFGLMDNLKLRRMDPEGFDVVAFGDDPVEYPYAMGYERFQERLLEKFPKEKEAISKYCAKLQEIGASSPLYNVQAPSGGDFFRTEYLTMNARDYIASLSSNTKLHGVLAGTNSLYAGIGDKSPLYVHALIVNSYIESSYKCIDGGAQIATHLSKEIKRFGGEIKNYAEASKFNFSGDEIKSVELKSGETFEGKTFISNIHPANTMEMVGQGNIRKAYYNRLTSLENTCGVFILYAVFKPDTFKYLDYNYYYHKNQDVVWDPLENKNVSWPPSYAMFIPASSKSEKYADCATVMAFMKYDDVKPWEDTFHTIPKHRTNRSESYEEFKERKCQEIIDVVNERFPNFRSSIKSFTASSPLTNRDYIGIKDGSIYGVLKDHKDPIKTFIPPKTKIPNLYFTGQNINLHGVLGVTISAVTTCAEFLGIDYLINEIKKAQ
ncbi:MAG: phytoene desaturase family protein [Cytophagaceae bacterium]